jgi:uncharacterized membrane protein (Fun14 family)
VNSESAQKSRPRTGLLNPQTMRQVSLGSVLGLVAGVGLRAFSKALVVILGMGVVFVEVCQVSWAWAGIFGFDLVC